MLKKLPPRGRWAVLMDNPADGKHALKGSFTQSERESNVTNKWAVLFSMYLFSLSDIKDQRKNSHLRSLGVKEA